MAHYTHVASDRDVLPSLMITWPFLSRTTPDERARENSKVDGKSRLFPIFKGL